MCHSCSLSHLGSLRLSPLYGLRERLRELRDYGS